MMSYNIPGTGDQYVRKYSDLLNLILKYKISSYLGTDRHILPAVSSTMHASGVLCAVCAFIYGEKMRTPSLRAALVHHQHNTYILPPSIIQKVLCIFQQFSYSGGYTLLCSALLLRCALRQIEEGGGGRTHSLLAFRNLKVGGTPLAKRSTVPTPNRDSSALITCFPHTLVLPT